MNQNDIDPNFKELIADREWRLRNLYHIKNKQGKGVLLRANAVQQVINKSKSKRKRILKARQQGVSTNGIIEQFDSVIHKRNFTACVLAHERDGLEKLFRIVRFAYNKLPDWYRPVLDKGGGSKYELYFPEINSRIYADLSVRGDTINHLHISEVAFIKDTDRIGATKEAVPIDGIIVEESTPNGLNHFYDSWHDPDSLYENLFFPWYFLPEYTLPVTSKLKITNEESVFIKKAKERYGVDITPGQIFFRRMKQSDLKYLFPQEYPEDPEGCFLSSGNAVMNLKNISDLIQASPDPIRDDGSVKVYREYQKDHKYVFGVDTAEGVDGDYCVAQLFDATKREQVAILRGKWKPSLFAHHINELAKQYVMGGRVMPLVAVERNNHGHAVILELDEHLQYPNLFRAPDEKLGWLTNNATRPILVNSWIDAVDDNIYKIYDKTTLQECMTLQNIDGKIEGAKGKHDDCIMAGAIAIQACLEYQLPSFYENVEENFLV